MYTKAALKKSVPLEDVLAEKAKQLDDVKAQCAAVEKMISVNSDQQKRLDAGINDVLRSIADVESRIDEMSVMLDGNVETMRQMAKVSKEQLQQQHGSLQRNIADAVKENDDLRVKLKQLVEQKKGELQQCQALVDTKQHEIDEKALVFGMQLKTSLVEVQQTPPAHSDPAQQNVVYSCATSITRCAEFLSRCRFHAIAPHNGLQPSVYVIARQVSSV